MNQVTEFYFYVDGECEHYISIYWVESEIIFVFVKYNSFMNDLTINFNQ